MAKCPIYGGAHNKNLYDYEKAMSNFKIALLSIFSICIVLGIAFFAMYRAGGNGLSASLTVWGTIAPDAFDSAYRASSLAANKQVTVTYVKKDPSTFDSDFVGRNR